MKQRIDRIMPWLLPVLLLTVIAFYYYVNPQQTAFPLRCPWRWLTGTQCPACGMQRALHALANGHIGEALAYNYFFIVSIPFAVVVVLTEWYNYHHVLDRLRAIVTHPYTLQTYVVLFCIWWVIRNIP